jgi:hypothetical protein
MVPNALVDLAQVVRCQLVPLQWSRICVIFSCRASSPRRGLHHLLRAAEQGFQLAHQPLFAGGAGYLLVLNMVDFLFRWLVAGAPICLYVRTDETFTLRMSRCET